MKRVQSSLVALLGAVTLSSCCCNSNDTAWLQNAIERSHHQLTLLSELSEEAIDNDKPFPRSIKKDGETNYIGVTDWTSGFFPGALWLGYELTGDEALAQKAREYTNKLESLQHFSGHHDTGFMVYCSYGEGARLKPEATDRDIMLTTAKTLCTRYTPEVGAIRSWDFGKWSYPVIIDNMMNLELLFWAANESGDESLREVAINHANKTLANHFREDATSYHVLSYLPDTGEVESKGTMQGFSDDSAWARGQAWGLYGFTMCYRFTHDERYLAHAERIAEFIMNNRPSESDYIPYWDYNAPNIPNAPRDASAATVAASALLELQHYAKDGKKYFDYAEQILRQLSSEEYMAAEGENNGFILRHSTGHHPAGLEVDTPLNYTDYYFLEALARYKGRKE